MRELFTVGTSAGASLVLAPLWWVLLRRQSAWLTCPWTVLGLITLMVAVAAGVAGRFRGDPALVAWWWAGVHTVPLAVVDLRWHRLPRCWLLSMAGGGVLIFATVAVVCREPSALLRLGLAGVGVWLVMRVVEWACDGRMGGGDTRLHAALAVYTGWISWHSVLLGLLAGTVLLGIGAGLTVLLGRRGWSSRIAAGPFLLAGAWLALVLTAG